jgi:hypothetical protein
MLYFLRNVGVRLLHYTASQTLHGVCCENQNVFVCLFVGGLSGTIWLLKKVMYRLLQLFFNVDMLIVDWNKFRAASVPSENIRD